MNNHHKIISQHVVLPPKVWGNFFEKSISQQFWRAASLPNYFQRDIQTLNFKITQIKNQTRFFHTVGNVFCPEFVLIFKIFE